MINISANVESELNRRLHIAAAERGWSKSRAIREALYQWLDQNPVDVLREFVEAIEDEHVPAFREPILSDGDRALLRRAYCVLGMEWNE